MTTKFQKALKVVQDRLAKDLDNGLLTAGMVLQAESQSLCPVKTGNLKNSATTRKHESSTDDRIVYVVGYEAVEYAIYVHEMDGPFKVGQPKFLEQPARQMASELGSYIQITGSAVKQR
jgi:hypothetical protein